MAHVARESTRAELGGVIVGSGPDLEWLTGYRPTAITERLTALLLVPGREPTLVVPRLERPDAEPGIYLPDRFGVLIEDIVTVPETGGRRLNNTDRALPVVE